MRFIPYTPRYVDTCVAQPTINKFHPELIISMVKEEKTFNVFYMPFEVLIEDFEIELLTLLNQQNKSIKAKRFMG